MTNKQKIVSILSCLTIGAVGGHHIDDIVEKYNLETNRYPLKVEYTITNNCLSAYKEPLAVNIYSQKIDICICALEKTEFEYDYDNYTLNKDVFLDRFEKKATECITMRN